MTTITPRILVHGGAGEWTNFDEEAVLQGARRAAEAGWNVLAPGGSALEAVEAAVIVLEDDPHFDAGYGSFLNRAGEVEMDAIICDGEAVNFGAVAAVRRVKNPISLARLVLARTEHCFIVADGADELAAEFGIPLVPSISLVTPQEFALFQQRTADGTPRAGLGTGTVGAVAMDSAGRLASATSTGGTPDKRRGRVGDSPIFGAGGYADPLGAASATGVGENIMRYLLCKNAVDRLAGSPAQAAAQAAAGYLAERIPSPEVGIILVDAAGRLGATHTTRAMPIAWTTGAGEITAAMQRRDGRDSF